MDITPAGKNQPSIGVPNIKTKHINWVRNRSQAFVPTIYRDLQRILTDKKTANIEDGGFEIIGILPGKMLSESTIQNVADDICKNELPGGARNLELLKNTISGPILASKVVCKLTPKKGEACFVIIPASVHRGNFSFPPFFAPVAEGKTKEEQLVNLQTYLDSPNPETEPSDTFKKYFDQTHGFRAQREELTIFPIEELRQLKKDTAVQTTKIKLQVPAKNITVDDIIPVFETMQLACLENINKSGMVKAGDKFILELGDITVGKVTVRSLEKNTEALSKEKLDEILSYVSVHSADFLPQALYETVAEEISTKIECEFTGNNISFFTEPVKITILLAECPDGRHIHTNLSGRIITGIDFKPGHDLSKEQIKFFNGLGKKKHLLVLLKETLK